MNNTLHTPGPWQVSPYNNITSRNGTVAKTEQMPGNYDSEPDANAHLISAAPDLLSALEELCADKYLSDPINADRMKNARTAIAKAKGEK